MLHRLFPSIVLGSLACTPTAQVASEPPSVEPSGVGLTAAPSLPPPRLPLAIDFGPDYEGQALRTIELADGVEIEVVHAGRGPQVVLGQSCQVRYAGFASTDGHVIDEARVRPATLLLAAAPSSGDLRAQIVGSIVGMTVGERRRVRIPAVVADRAQINAEQTGDVWVTVELLGFEDPQVPAELDAFEGPPLASETRDGGLEVHDYATGQGVAAKAGDSIEIHYILTLPDGTVVDTTHGRGSFVFQVGAGMVIPGFDAGLIGAKPGMLRKLVVPSALAYGERSVGSIPAHSTLLFYLEIVAVTPA